MLRGISHLLTVLPPDVPVIWDPVLRATAGKEFFCGSTELTDLTSLSLITPNLAELTALAEVADREEALKKLASYVPVYAKSFKEQGDYLFNVLQEEGVMREFPVPRLENAEKHGSGCVLSTAIACGLAHGKSVASSIEGAERYIKAFLKSDPGLLGYHAGEFVYAP